MGSLKIGGAGVSERVADVKGAEVIPEGLGGEDRGSEAPEVGEEGTTVPVGDLGLEAWGADAVEGGEEEETWDGGVLGRRG